MAFDFEGADWEKISELRFEDLIQNGASKAEIHQLIQSTMMACANTIREAGHHIPDEDPVCEQLLHWASTAVALALSQYRTRVIQQMAETN